MPYGRHNMQPNVISVLKDTMRTLWKAWFGWSTSNKNGFRGGALARRASFFDHSPLLPVFAPASPYNLEYLLAVSQNLAHPLHPVHDDGKGGGWKWWE